MENFIAHTIALVIVGVTFTIISIFYPRLNSWWEKNVNKNKDSKVNTNKKTEEKPRKKFKFINKKILFGLIVVIFIGFIISNLGPSEKKAIKICNERAREETREANPSNTINYYNVRYTLCMREYGYDK